MITAEKVKKLLADTIEFSQKTNINASKKLVTESTVDALNPGVASGFKRKGTTKGPERQSSSVGNHNTSQDNNEQTHTTISNAPDLGHQRLNEAQREILMARKHLGFKEKQDGVNHIHDSIDIVDLKKEVDLETGADYHNQDEEMQINPNQDSAIQAMGGVDEKEYDQLKDLIQDYVITNHFQPRDFDSKIPILTQIGA